jgi:hypothetical protein
MILGLVLAVILVYLRLTVVTKCGARNVILRLIGALDGLNKLSIIPIILSGSGVTAMRYQGLLVITPVNIMSSTIDPILVYKRFYVVGIVSILTRKIWRSD